MGRTLIRRGVWLLILWLHVPAWSLDPGRGLDGYGRQVWRTDGGLPQNTVRALAQTRDGYIWLATEGGLVRFDGVDFAIFDRETTPQFLSDTVYDLLEDHEGQLWISTASGLVTYRAGVFSAYSTSQGLPADRVWFCYQDSRGRLWAMTAAGPAWLDGKRFVAVAGAGDAAPVSRQAMAEDSDGKLWLGGNRGVFALDLAPPVPHLALHLLGNNAVGAIAAGAAHQVWIGTSEGLERYSQGALGMKDPRSPASKAEILALLAEPNGAVWAATAAGVVEAGSRDGLLAAPRVNRFFRDRQGALWMTSERGVYRLWSGQLASFAPRSELASSHVLSLLEDREGDLWLGTDSGGVNLLRDQTFTTYTTSDGLSGNFVRCVVEDAERQMWIGTDGAGLNRRTPQGFAHLTTADGLSSNVILSLAAGNNGDLWAGTPDGLNRIHYGHNFDRHDKPEVERFTSADGLPDDFIRSLFHDPDGSLWIGTRHGLAHLVDGRFTRYTTREGLGSEELGGDVVGAIARWGGDLWIGTSSGLSRRHQGRFVNYDVGQGAAKPGEATQVVTALGPAGAEELWLGTNGGGLHRLRNVAGTIEILPVRARGLPAVIYGILEDGSGRLWLSAQTGVYRVSIAQLNAFLGGNPTWPAVTVFGTADGMNIREASGGGHPAAWKRGDGSLWFSTLEGVSATASAQSEEGAVPPAVVIEQVLVDDQPRAAGQSLDQVLTLAPGSNRLEVHYAGLSFAAPQKVQYRYRLEGFDGKWIEAGSRRTAFYTNLPPGRYRFRVLAANKDGAWNSVGASLSLRLKPHYYQTGWFYAALVLAALGLGYLAYRWRVREVEARFGAVLAERGRLAREIHDTLAQGFVGISVQLELVARLFGSRNDKPPEPVLEHLDHARALVRDSLAEARSSIWDLRSAAAGDLPARLTQSTNRIAGGSSSKVYLQVKGTYRALDRTTEEELLRIAEEAVANAVRHGAAPRIEVQLLYEAARMNLLVADNGCGFTPLAGRVGPEGHYGLRGMHERAAQIGAVLRVESAPGKGTKVSVEAPLA